VCELDLHRPAGIPDGPADKAGPPQNVQNAGDLRQGFSSVLESCAAPAVITNADGWITHANTSTCRLLAAATDRALISIPREEHDECPPMPHWLDGRHCVVESDYSPHRLAYFDSWSLVPTLVHLEDLIGCVTAVGRDTGAALSMIAVDRNSSRIPYDEAATHGSIVRIAPDDFLVVLPNPSVPEETAVAVQRVADSIDRHRRHPPRSDTPQSHTWGSGQERETERFVAALGDALQCHSLSVHYQPQFDVKTGRGSGVEALARWVLPSGESIAPSVFIPAAERAGKIHALGAWLLKSACETAYAWCGREAQRTTLSVNVSPQQLDEEFSAVIGRALEKSRFPAKRLELEITESALLANPELTIRHLNQCRELGLRIAIDDFGTDYSSLRNLPRLPVDRLKLDPSLIHRMTQDRKSAAAARLIVSMGLDLGIDVIAEGVETEQQLQMLAEVDCPMAQGYLLGRPMPAKQAQVALRKPWGDRLELTMDGARPRPATWAARN
jgi:EAL domain-containing protein (putative c-di-GMP-specific phosphodiesterase class I)